jgi:hypothetical protein
MGLLTFFENFNLIFNCNKGLKKQEELSRQLFDVSKKLKISILPISQDSEIENLYPSENHVYLWNVFVVGSDKRYVHSKIGNESCLLSKKYLNLKDKDIMDTKGGVMPSELFDFFDKLWDLTLNGRNLQLYVMMNGKLYLINTYSFKNSKNKIVGAVCFMRDFQNFNDKEIQLETTKE